MEIKLWNRMAKRGKAEARKVSRQAVVHRSVCGRIVSW